MISWKESFTVLSSLSPFSRSPSRFHLFFLLHSSSSLEHHAAGKFPSESELYAERRLLEVGEKPFRITANPFSATEWGRRRRTIADWGTEREQRTQSIKCSNKSSEDGTRGRGIRVYDARRGIVVQPMTTWAEIWG